MHSRITVTVTLLAVAAALVGAMGVDAAEPVIHVRPEVLQLKKADLIVQAVKLAKLGEGDFPTGEVEVTVKNKGEGKSGECILAGIHIQDAGTTPPPRLVVVTSTIGPLEPQETQTVKLNFEAVGRPWRAMLIVAVDAPAGPERNGQVTELNEKNNIFGTSFDMTDTAFPCVLKGPGAE